MPTIKIRDLEKKEMCRDPEHTPPMHQIFEDGIYEHTCPNCGHIEIFTVRSPRWEARFNG